ncbi:MAG: protein TolR [Alphaproteobacteria bacterium]|nr:protein TolR [Alphaproteobacteria bacterium]
MSVSLGGDGPRSGVRVYKRRTYRPMSEINVTPFVDVMLVLLIIFMVTAPLLTVGVPVDLPKNEAAPINEPEEPLVVTMDIERRVYIQETPVEIDNLVSRLAAITETSPDTRIYVRGDQGLPYGEVMGLMGRLAAAGFNKVALVAETPKPDETQ